MNLGTTTADALRADLILQFRKSDESAAKSYAECCVLLATLRDTLREQMGAGEGREEVRRCRREDLTLGDAPASKMLLVADHIGIGGMTHPAVYQYTIARSVKLGKGSAEEMLAEADAMPMQDFIATYELVKPREVNHKRLVCPACGVVEDAERFEEVAL